MKRNLVFEADNLENKLVAFDVSRKKLFNKFFELRSEYKTMPEVFTAYLIWLNETYSNLLKIKNEKEQGEKYD